MKLITYLNVFFSEIVFLFLIVTFVNCDSSSEESQKSVNKKDIIKTKVQVYIESLCPYCTDYIHNQLAPAFRKYSDYIQLDMLPFGNTELYYTEDGSLDEISCQHGPQECIGDLYEACANKLLQDKDPKKLMEYYDCLTVKLDKKDMKKSAEKCANELHINFETLTNCTNNEGQGLILDYGNRTEMAGIDNVGVPAIGFDDKLQPDNQDAIRSNFVKALCDTLKGAKPSDCNSGA